MEPATPPAAVPVMAWGGGCCKIEDQLLWERSCISHIGNFLLTRPFEAGVSWPMQIIAKRVLREFWTVHNQAEPPLRAWFALVDKAEWSGPQDMKVGFGTTVDFASDTRIIFDTREAIFDAMERREVYATTGTRMAHCDRKLRQRAGTRELAIRPGSIYFDWSEYLRR